MFTGLVEAVSRIDSCKEKDAGLELCLSSTLQADFHVGQSVAHDGVCLTVTNTFKHASRTVYDVFIASETLAVTSLRYLKQGTQLNIERALRLNDRLEGHLLQGHVDCTAKIRSIDRVPAGWDIWIEYPADFQKLLFSKCSIAVNGISFTVAELDDSHMSLRICVIPLTRELTNIASWQENLLVNLEFDCLAKQFQRNIDLRLGS